MIVKINNAVGFGPYRHRQAFLTRLWLLSEQEVEERIRRGETPANDDTFMAWRIRLRRALFLHAQLKQKYPDPVRDFLTNMGQAFNLK